MAQKSKGTGAEEEPNLSKELARMKHEQDIIDRKLKEARKKFEKQQNLLKEMDHSILMMHANELKWIYANSRLKLDNRMKYVYSGDVKNAIRAIEFLETQNSHDDHIQNALRGFEMTYGISRDQIKPKISTAPSEIVDILDRRGTLRKQEMWKDNFAERTDKWIETCDNIVHNWLRMDLFEDGEKKDYHEFVEWMADGLKRIKHTASECGVNDLRR